MQFPCHRYRRTSIVNRRISRVEICCFLCRPGSPFLWNWRLTSRKGKISIRCSRSKSRGSLDSLEYSSRISKTTVPPRKWYVILFNNARMQDCPDILFLEDTYRSFRGARFLQVCSSTYPYYIWLRWGEDFGFRRAVGVSLIHDKPFYLQAS